jgi:glycosyltransferase involved in cell wall biosynthesis
MPEISIIVRTKNEERWIAHCLAMLYKQDYYDFEVILVDNASTDHTIKVANRFQLAATINVDEYLPGYALNQGIRASRGRFIVCLSAHCIPKEDNWLSCLLSNFEKDEKVAGVYGRQLPLSYSSTIDKRDLLIVFGQDRRVQVKDYFFHNANSMLRRDIWEKYPFDEGATNIEDRLWGKTVTNAGFHIIYDPNAAVYHHHGLHQSNTPQRAKGVVSVIEKIDSDVLGELPESLRPEQANIVAIVPVKGEIKLNSAAHNLLSSSIEALKLAKYVNSIYLVSSDVSLAKQLDVTFIDRGRILSIDSLDMDELLQKSLEIIESRGDFPEALLFVNYDYLDRPQGLFDELIRDAQYEGYDTVFPGYVDYGHYWVKNVDGEYRQTDASLKGRSERQPVFRALYGLGCVTSSSIIRSGKIIGGKVGILPVDHVKHSLRLRDAGRGDFETCFENILTKGNR